jgi:hypothetical protein
LKRPDFFQNSLGETGGPPVRLKSYLERLENEGVARVKVNIQNTSFSQDISI